MVALCSQTGTCRCVPYSEKGTGSLRETAAEMWRANVEAFSDFSGKVVSVIEGSSVALLGY